MSEEEAPKGMDDATRRALAAHVYGVFADPKASSADVLEAFIGQLALEDRIIYTASGELGVHLQSAVEALRNTTPVKRRFLGMPRVEGE